MKVGVTLLASGSNGNCCAIHANGNIILVDCGICYREVSKRLAQMGVPGEVTAILVTHRHTDHIKGVDVTARKYGVPVFATKETVDTLQALYPRLAPPAVIGCDECFSNSGFDITSFHVEHDVDTVGYTFTYDDVKIGIATDIGKVTKSAEYNLRDCTTLVLESNFDVNMLWRSGRPQELIHRISSGKGHLSNAQNSEILPRLISPRTRNLLLAHVSGDCNTYDLAKKTAQETLAALHREDIFLECGTRENPIPTVWN